MRPQPLGSGQRGGGGQCNARPGPHQIRRAIQWQIGKGGAGKEFHHHQAGGQSAEVVGHRTKDIATDWYTIEPLYEDYDSLRIKGYRIRNIVEITMRDVTKSNDAIVTAFQAGANEVVDVQFYTSELRKYRDQARELAMKAAREKADALSNTVGAEVACVLTINENTQSNFYWGGWWWYRYNSNQNMMAQNVVQNAAPSGGESSTLDDGPLSAGQISVRAEVMASFGLK